MTTPAPVSSEMRKIALLAACASILQILESFFPSPVPGVRLGLANVVAVVALIDLGARAALEVAVLRTVISSFILGTFLSPTFILSFCAAIASTAAMAVAHRWSNGRERSCLSPVGLSLIGSTVHNATQIGLVYALLARHPGVFLLLPWLGLSAIAMGWITGLAASQACRRLQAPVPCGEPHAAAPAASARPLPSTRFEPGSSLLHRAPAAAKIVATSALAVLVVCLHDNRLFAVVALMLCLCAMAGRMLSLRWFAVVLKLRLFLVFAFLAPLLLVQTGAIWFALGPVVIADEGVAAACRVVWRIVLLMLGTALLTRTTSPDDLAGGVGKLLAPLRFVGVPSERLALILSLSWSSIPVLWGRAHETIRQHPAGRRWRHLIPMLGDTIALLYHEANDVAADRT